MFKDYYEILEISRYATSEEIKSAYRAMSKKWHPDKNPDNDVTQKMQDINEAYAILKDENKRNRYDLEYSRFKEQFKAQTINNATDKTENQESEYSYDYNVNDEILKQYINEAREYAKKLVEEFVSSFRTATKDAVKGAWDGVKGYIYGVFILSVIIFIIGTCSSLVHAYENSSNHIVEQYSNKTFVIPDTWQKYTFSNNAFSIYVPNTVELRTEYDEYTVFMHENGYKYNNDVAIFQQKGLSSKPANIDEHYCRIMIQYIKGNPGDFLHSNQTEIIDYEWKTILKEMVTSGLGLYTLLREPVYRWIDINGIKAIETTYRRTGNNNNTTIGKIYLLFNNNECVKITIAYRESEKELWCPDLDNVIETFKWN